MNPFSLGEAVAACGGVYAGDAALLAGRCATYALTAEK